MSEFGHCSRDRSEPLILFRNVGTRKNNDSETNSINFRSSTHFKKW